MEDCWLKKSALDALIVEGSSKFPKETGGLLVGYWAEGKPVITNIIGPGPSAKHDRFNFEPDYTWQTKAVSDFYEANEGKETYLGDWHTHPMGVTDLSSLDVQAMNNIANFESARASSPLMLVLGGTLDILSVFCLSDGQIVPLDVTTF